MTDALEKQIRVIQQLKTAVRLAFPDGLSLEDAARLAWASRVPTPKEVMDWCDEYRRLERVRYDEAKAFYEAEKARLMAQDD